MSATPFDVVPIIDLLGRNFSTLEEEIAVARRVGKACAEVGFLYVVNHGISAEILAEAFRWSERFFAQEHKVKMQCDQTRSKGGIRGYVFLSEMCLL